jgi:5-methylcytosine-specific restriction endonuclease McrA
MVCGMQWNYQCPLCGQWRMCEWDDRNGTRKCHITNADYIVPGPAEQHQAFVDTDEWPKEMEEVVFAVKGHFCTSPLCVRKSTKADTLDHAIPLAKGGETSVRNLDPMCTSCNCSKGGRTRPEWLIELIAKAMDWKP